MNRNIILDRSLVYDLSYLNHLQLIKVLREVGIKESVWKTLEGRHIYFKEDICKWRADYFGTYLLYFYKEEDARNLFKDI